MNKCEEIQLIYLCPIEGIVMYFSDAIVVQVPAIRHKIIIL